MRTEFLEEKNKARIQLGQKGEQLAWDYLVKKGYRILDKNYRCRLGEIDVVAEKGRRITVIEIRTCSGERFGRPEESIGAVKQRKLVRLAEWYLKDKKKMGCRVSFDVVAVTFRGNEFQEIRLIENAFSADGLEKIYG